jgi:hypothetical protein
MKPNSHGLLMLSPAQQHAILDQIRNDRELVARLNITPQELHALSKCALLGTLSCKEDMLFILRQIREATGPTSGQMLAVPEQGAYSKDEEQEDPPPDFRRIQSSFAVEIISDGPRAPEGLVRRRLPRRFRVLFLAAIILAAVLFWNGISAMSRWRDILVTSVGTSVSHASASEAWFNHFDRFSVLLSWEILFVVGIIGAIYFRSLGGLRRFKVRPGRRY